MYRKSRQFSECSMIHFVYITCYCLISFDITEQFKIYYLVLHRKYKYHRLLSLATNKCEHKLSTHILYIKPVTFRPSWDFNIQVAFWENFRTHCFSIILLVICRIFSNLKHFAFKAVEVEQLYNLIFDSAQNYCCYSLWKEEAPLVIMNQSLCLFLICHWCIYTMYNKKMGNIISFFAYCLFSEGYTRYLALGLILLAGAFLFLGHWKIFAHSLKTSFSENPRKWPTSKPHSKDFKRPELKQQ